MNVEFFTSTETFAVLEARTITPSLRGVRTKRIAKRDIRRVRSTVRDNRRVSNRATRILLLGKCNVIGERGGKRWRKRTDRLQTSGILAS